MQSNYKDLRNDSFKSPLRNKLEEKAVGPIKAPIVVSISEDSISKKVANEHHDEAFPEVASEL
uniref:AlNc14C71G4885 protein n=1 Tax=Albugo laibachii Nc14 TaxID=890382 RepID=F0WE24_9STRA|nr:AlNc14C71G4885 [Albugo laibachii Nc14]|eukprot:CCA19453.1 AlNc14C71G4885 [Albugo laibachii Nc14]